jgi:hypothetical protein
MTDKVFIQFDSKIKEAKEENLSYLESWRLDLETLVAEEDSKKKAVLDSKKSAIEKLTSLGLTQQEVFGLLGISPDEPEAE